MHDHPQPLPVKILAVILGASLIMLSPGLDFYNVWAEDLIATPVVEHAGIPAAPVAGTPSAAAASAAGAPGVALSAAALQGVPATLPGVSAPAAQAPGSEAAAPQAEAAAGALTSEAQAAPASLQSVAAPLSDLDHAMNRPGGANLGAARAALSRFFENAGQQAPADNGVAAPVARNDKGWNGDFPQVPGFPSKQLTNGQAEHITINDAKVYDYNNPETSVAVEKLHIRGNYLYTTGAGTDEVVKIEKDTGKIAGRMSIRGKIYGPIAGMDSDATSLYAAAGSDKLLVMDPDTLRVRRTITLPSMAWPHDVRVQGKAAYIAVSNVGPDGMAGVLKVSLKSGKILAQYPVPLDLVKLRYAPPGGLALDGNTIYLAYGGQVLSLDQKTGAYQFALRREVVRAPNGLAIPIPETAYDVQVVGDKLVIADEYHGIEIADKATGDLVQHIQTSKGLWSMGVAVDQGKMYVGSGWGGLSVFDVPAVGAMAQYVPEPSPQAAPQPSLWNRLKAAVRSIKGKLGSLNLGERGSIDLRLAGAPEGAPRYADPAEAYPLALQKASEMAASYGYDPKDLAFARAIAVEEPQGPAWAFEFHMPSAGGVFVTYRVIVRGTEASSLDWTPKFPENTGLSIVTKPLSPYAVSAGTKRTTPEAALRAVRSQVLDIRRVPVALFLVKDAATGDENFAYAFVTAGGSVAAVDAASGKPLGASAAAKPSRLSAWERFKDHLGMFGISMMLAGALIGIPVSVGLLASFGLAYAAGWSLPVAMLAVGAGSAVILAAVHLLGPDSIVPGSFEDRHSDLISYAMLTLLFSAATGLIGGGAAWLFTHAAAHLAATASTGGAAAAGLATLAPKDSPTPPGQPQKPWIERNWKLVAGIAAVILVAAVAAWFFAHVSVSWTPAAVTSAGMAAWFGLGLSRRDDVFSALSSLQTPKVDEVEAFRHVLHALDAQITEQLTDGKSVRDLGGDVVQVVMDVKKFFDVKPTDPAGARAVADVQSFLSDFARRAALLSRETDEPALYQKQVRELLGAAEYAASTSQTREELLARLGSVLSQKTLRVAAAAAPAEDAGGIAKVKETTANDVSRTWVGRQDLPQAARAVWDGYAANTDLEEGPSARVFEVEGRKVYVIDGMIRAFIYYDVFDDSGRALASAYQFSGNEIMMWNKSNGQPSANGIALAETGKDPAVPGDGILDRFNWPAVVILSAPVIAVSSLIVSHFAAISFLSAAAFVGAGLFAIGVVGGGLFLIFGGLDGGDTAQGWFLTFATAAALAALPFGVHWAIPHVLALLHAHASAGTAGAAALSLGGAAAPSQRRADLAEKLSRWGMYGILAGAAVLPLVTLGYMATALVGHMFLGYGASEIDYLYAPFLVWSLLGGLVSSVVGTAMAAVAGLLSRKDKR